MEKQLIFDDKVMGRKLFYVQFRGPETTKFIENLKRIDVSLEPIYTTVKVKNVMPSLKTIIDKNMHSNVV